MGYVVKMTSFATALTSYQQDTNAVVVPKENFCAMFGALIKIIRPGFVY